MAEKTIVKEDEWLEFCLEEEKPKTKVFSVRSKFSKCLLGVIKWYPSWRHYCFFPETSLTRDEFVYSDRCLLSIWQFVLELNVKHDQEVSNNKNVQVCEQRPT